MQNRKKLEADVKSSLSVFTQLTSPEMLSPSMSPYGSGRSTAVADLENFGGGGF